MTRAQLDYLTRALLSGVCAVVLAYVAWQIVAYFLSIIELLAAAALLAFVISPVVDWLDRFMWRAAAALITYLGIALLLVGSCYLLFGPLIVQLSDAVVHLPRENVQIQQRLREIDRQLALHGIVVNLAASQSRVVHIAQLQGGDLVDRTLSVARSIATLLLNALLCLVISIYLVIDGQRLHDQFFRVVPTRYREQLFFVEAAVNTIVGGYVRGQLILEFTVALLAGVGCWWLGLPYPVLLAILAAILQLVPMLGPMLAAVPPILAAFTEPDPTSATIKVVVYFLVIEQFMTNVLGPRITGHAVGLHPLGAIVALLVGGKVYGALGALVAAPIAGVVYVLAVAVYWRLTGQQVPVRRHPMLAGAGNVLRRRGARHMVVVNEETPSVVEITTPTPTGSLRAIEEARDELISRFTDNTVEQPAPAPDEDAVEAISVQAEARVGESAAPPT